MSVLIRNMSVPDSCNDCPLNDGITCDLTGKDWNWGMTSRRSDCPLVPAEDAVSRKAVLDIVNNPLNIRLDDIIRKMPSIGG